MATFKIHIAAVDQVLFDGEAEAVTVPGSDGTLTVLPHHEALVSTLRPGVVSVRGSTDGNSSQTFEVTSGVIEVSNNRATILL